MKKFEGRLVFIPKFSGDLFLKKNNRDILIIISCLLPNFYHPNGFSVYGIIHFYDVKKGSIFKAVVSKFLHS